MLSGARAGAFHDAQDVVHAASQRRRLLHLPQPVHDRALRRIGACRGRGSITSRTANGHYAAGIAREAALPGRGTASAFSVSWSTPRACTSCCVRCRLLRAEGFTGFLVEINGDNLRYASAADARGDRGVSRREGAAAADGADRVQPTAPTRSISSHARMARVDWCIVPSIWWEIFGLVISEAWMFGKPVICSNVGGPAERIGTKSTACTSRWAMPARWRGHPPRLHRGGAVGAAGGVAAGAAATGDDGGGVSGNLREYCFLEVLRSLHLRTLK